MATLTLFYSYAHEDEALRDQLEKHLIQLQRQELIATWHDRKIPPGDVRVDEIDRHLENASIILLLVSPDFLVSNYCYEIEMQRALERHRLGLARVVPIILRPCGWQRSPLKDLQCLPRDGKPVTQWLDQDEAFLTIMESLSNIIEQQAHPFVPLSSLDRQNRGRMLRRVRAIWIDGLLTLSLHLAIRIELSLQGRPDVLANPWRLQVQELNQAPRALPDGTSIVQVYDGAEGELLLLGEPGAGKTTLLLELARTLLERAEQDERLRMPIVFHLSSWAEKRQSLSLWLVEELATKYQVPRKIGRSWIDADQVLPLLDGLDEVARDTRSACVEQINDYYQSRLERGSSPIVVCCRSEEYTALSTRVMLQHAVSILPLTDFQINTYLEQAGEQVQGLRQALDEDAELHNLARQPLMLNIFTFAYQGAMAAEVSIGETREEIRCTVFARYVEHMLKRRGQSRRWEEGQVIRWLSFLAKQMQEHKQSVFSVENLQPDWLSRGWRICYRWCVVLVFGLVYGLIFGPTFERILRETVGTGTVIKTAMETGQVTGPTVMETDQVTGPIMTIIGPTFWLLLAVLCGLVVGMVIERDAWISPVEALIWPWKKRPGLGSGLVIAVFIALAVGLAAGLQIGHAFGPFLGLIGGLVVGLCGGLPVGLSFWLFLGLSRMRFPERLSFSPNEGIWHSGKNGVVFGLVLGLALGLVTSLVFGAVSGLFLGLISGLFLGLTGLVALGLFGGLDAFVKHFILRFLLSQRGDLPWNLILFLDEATERLLLRKVGGSYIFVHRVLLEYFAALEEKDEANHIQ